MILPNHSRHASEVERCGRLVEVAERAVRKLAFAVEGDDLEGENRRLFAKLARTDADVLGALRRKWVRF